MEGLSPAYNLILRERECVFSVFSEWCNSIKPLHFDFYSCHNCDSISSLHLLFFALIISVGQSQDTHMDSQRIEQWASN